jgi:hypothetical protein
MNFVALTPDELADLILKLQSQTAISRLVQTEIEAVVARLRLLGFEIVKAD